MFKFLKAFGVDLFNFLRKPEALSQVEAGDADNHDHQQHLSQSLKITDNADNCFAKKVSGPAQDKHPKETTAQRKKDKPQIGHAAHAIKNARGPAQTIN